MDPENSQYTHYFNTNREAWNWRTHVHIHSAFYNVPAFIKGHSSLNPIEIQEVGPVVGKKLLHLQCHFGLDSISWARNGAVVTAVDFSDEAINYARQLSHDVDVSVEFVCCNLYELRNHLHNKFDIVFTSYGVLGWLPDLQAWAALIAEFLNPGGIFYLIEFHPFVWMLDENLDRVKYHYHNVQTISDTQEGTYADRSARILYQEYSWNHSLSEVVNALVSNGLQVEFLHEFPFSSYNCFNNLVQGEDGYWHVRGLENKIPLMYSLRCVKLL